MARARTFHSLLIGLTAALAIASWEGAARAQPSRDGINAALSLSHLSSSGGSATAVDLDLSALLSFGGFGVGADVGFLIGKVSDVADTTKFKLLNPFIGGYYGVDIAVAKLQVGAGVSLPLISVDSSSLQDAAAEIVALGTTLGGHGAWNLWMYQPKATTVIVPARLSLGLLGLVGAAVEGAVAINHRGDTAVQGMGVTLSAHGGNDLIYQLAAEAYLGLGIEPGLRVQWVHVPTGSGGENDVQIAVIPFVRVGAGPVHLEGAFLYNVTKPYGPSFSDSADSAHVYSFHVAATVSL
jgi:hypothetical protein